MSPRSFNRALGETSLELKCLALFGVFLLLVIGFSFFLYWQVTEKVVREKNPDTGKLLADQAMVIRHWEEFERESAKRRGGRDDFLLVIQDLTEKLNNQQYRWRLFFSPDSPFDQEGRRQPQDDIEKELLERFARTSPGDTTDEDRPDYFEVSDGEWYQYYQPVRAGASCLALCHPPISVSGPTFDPAGLGGGIGARAEGDLMAIIHVTIPNARTRDAISLYWNTLLAVAIITAFLAMIAFYITIRYVIVRPLKHLRDVSDAISHGNIAMRAEIHTGDEFEALGVAFNRMLRHLTTIQNELRQANTKLDGKVDELAQVNMQLYEMNRVKSDFMATMSHELRTPLNSILGFSDVLGSIDALDEKQQRYVENIQKSGQLLLDMINNILDLAKIESGKMEVQLTDFDITQVVTTQCDMARPLTEKKNIDLDAEIQPGLPPLHQDQGRVHQILNNLLSNAIKFTPEGGRIRVAAERNQRQRLVLKVIDTGVGIAEEDQQAIFEKFRQGGTAMPAGEAITREYSGTGLGLSIVQELCKLLEGEVSVQSALGTGSTFTVHLPWKLEKQPRLDSSLMAGFEQFAKPQIDPRRDRIAKLVSPLKKSD